MSDGLVVESVRLVLLDRVDVAGVGDDGGHAAKLFE